MNSRIVYFLVVIVVTVPCSINGFEPGPATTKSTPPNTVHQDLDTSATVLIHGMDGEYSNDWKSTWYHCGFPWQCQQTRPNAQNPNSDNNYYGIVLKQWIV